MEAANIAIRPLTLDDSTSAASLVTQLGYPTTPQQIGSRLERFISDSDHALFVAAQQERVVGLVGGRIGYALEYDEPYVRVIGLAVDQQFRHGGIGKMLMRHLEQWATSNGASRVILTSGSNRTEAHKFYEHIGYERTGVRFVKPLN